MVQNTPGIKYVNKECLTYDGDKVYPFGEMGYDIIRKGNPTTLSKRITIRSIFGPLV